MENSCRKNLKQSSKKWVIASVYPKFRRNSALRSTNADLYHYAGNSPVRYIDPDGRKTYALTDEQWLIVKIAKKNVSNNLQNLITILRDSNNDISKVDKNIIAVARTYLTSEFGTCLIDCTDLASRLEEVKTQIDSLNRFDFKYDDKKTNWKGEKFDCFAKTNPFSGKIKLYNMFFESHMNKGKDTKEGTIFHEATHSIKVFATFDITYNPKEMKDLNDDGLIFTKCYNANNWEYFYEEIFN